MSSSRSRLPAAERRAQFLDVAAELLGEVAVGCVTMEMVAQRAEVSTGLAYARFRNIDDLLVALYCRDAEHLLSRLRAGGGASTEELIATSIAAYFAHVADRGPVVPLLRLWLWDHCPDRRDETGVIEAALGEWVSRVYGLKAPKASVVAWMIASTADSMVGAWLRGRLTRPEAERLCVEFLREAIPAAALALGARAR